MMAVCGASSVLSLAPFQYDWMDPCSSTFLGVLQSSLLSCRITKLESEASSCLSATMGNPNEPEDSGASQPPPRNTGDARLVQAAQISAPGSLELSISSFNDAQGSGGLSQQRMGANNSGIEQQGSTLRVVSVLKEEGLECSADIGVKQEKFSWAESASAGPPKKRARMENTLGFSLDERLPSGELGDSLRRLSSDVVVSQDMAGRHMVPNLFSGRESGANPSIQAGTQSAKAGQQLWWLTQGSAGPLLVHQSDQSPSAIKDLHLEGRGGRGEMGDAPLDGKRGRGQLGDLHSDARGCGGGELSSLRERDSPFKSPTYHPHMLSSLENKQDPAASHMIISSPGGEWLQRSTKALSTSEHPSKDSAPSRLGSSNVTASEEALSRAASTSYSRSGTVHEISDFLGQGTHHSLQLKNSGLLERQPTPSEAAQLTGSDMKTGFRRVPPGLQLPEGSSQEDANTNFYARIVGVMPSEMGAQQVPAVGGFSQSGGFVPTLSWDRLHSTASIGQMQAGQVHPPFLEDHLPQGLNLQHVTNETVVRNLLANTQSGIHIPSFMDSMRPADALRPDFSSLELLQLIQRSSERYPRHGVPQGVGNPPLDTGFHSAPATSQFGLLPTELNLSLPAQAGHTAFRRSPSSMQEVLSPPQGSLHVSSQQRHRTLSRTLSSAGAPAGPDLPGDLVFPNSLQLDLSFPGREVPPSVTAVMEGRSIGQRICLYEYNSYESFARAMRGMFEDNVSPADLAATGQNLHLANAVPGYVIAYEDDEGDLLLAGDLTWREFVRAAKRIRIVSASKSSRPNVTTGPSS